MFIYLDKLCERLKQSEKFSIYGSGYYGQLIYAKLCTLGWKDRIESFIVTKKDAQQAYINGVEIIEFDASCFENTNTMILVGVGKEYRQEIAHHIGDRLGKQIIFLCDYFDTDEQQRDILLKGTFEELCQYVVDQYIFENPLLLGNKSELLAELENTVREHQKMSREDRLLVYVMEEETARSVKILCALRQAGYQIKVLQDIRKSGYVARQELTELGIEIVEFDGLYTFLINSLKYKPLLYHIESMWFNFYYAIIAIRHNELWGKTVFAPQEILKGSFINIPENTFIYEKYCLENADGIVWRYFSKEYLEKKWGYVYKGESIQLLDNCSGYLLKKREMRLLEEKLKICCVVSHIDSFLAPSNENCFTRQARFEDILNKLDDSCIFDVYAWHVGADSERQLKELEQKYAFFRVFKKVNHEELIQRISEYDYGTDIFTNEKIPAYPLGAETIGYGYLCTEGSYRYSVANRYFDYIDAELPVITTLPEKLCEYLKQYHVIVEMNSNNLDIAYLKANKKYYQKKAREAKQKLLMSNHINLLTGLYEKISNSIME